MLLNVPREDAAASSLAAAIGPTGRWFGAGLAVVLAVEIVWALSRVGLSWFGQDPETLSVSSVTRIGSELFTKHAFAFEATSILILVAMVGAVVLARKEKSRW
jgi:NADH-quinone oxidoreductase subunit J